VAGINSKGESRNSHFHSKARKGVQKFKRYYVKLIQGDPGRPEGWYDSVQNGQSGIHPILKCTSDMIIKLWIRKKWAELK
jgi:hypothetical protein